MKVVLLTSGSLRHRHVAQRLAAAVDLVGVVVEDKPADVAAPAETRRDVIAEHFAGRDEAEVRFFAGAAFPDVPLLRVPVHGVNAPGTRDWIVERGADALVLFGTRIIRDPLLSQFDGRIINMHLGLSPYYRGSGTNFWPLADNLLECVGVTIHLAVAAVDAGPILAQCRPDLHADDGLHDIGCRAILAGADRLGAVVRAYGEGAIEPFRPDNAKGKVYRRGDFNADAVIAARDNLARGMVPAYLREARERQARFPIYELEKKSTSEG